MRIPHRQVFPRVISQVADEPYKRGLDFSILGVVQKAPFTGC